MLEKHYIQKKDNTDLNVYRCGIESCVANHMWGPGVRDHFLVHIIQDGKGILSMGRKSFHLSQGDGFVLPPNVLASWEADASEPWTYAWVGFHGLKATSILRKTGLSEENPVFQQGGSNQLHKSMMATVEAARQEENRSAAAGSDLMLTGHLYLFLSELIDICRQQGRMMNSSGPSRHVQKAMDYMMRHYLDSFSVENMAKALSLDRSYLSTLIKKTTGQSPQAHLIRIRMEKAMVFMNHPQLSIADIARSVGYNDPAQFSKTFHKVFGIPPMQARKQCFTTVFQEQDKVVEETE